MSNPPKVAYLISALDKSGPVNILYGIIRHLDCDPGNLIIITLKDIPEERSREQDFLDLGVRVIHAKLSTFNLLSGYGRLKKILLKMHGSSCASIGNTVFPPVILPAGEDCADRTSA